MTGDSAPQNPSIFPVLFGGSIDAVTQKATTQQQNAHKNDQAIGRPGVDPPYVTNQEPPPETMTHQQIYDAAHSIDKEALSKLVNTWAKSSVNITSLFQLHRMGVERALQGQWEGQTAEAGQQAAMRFAHAGEQTGQVAESAGFRLDSMYNAALAFAVAVPPVPKSTAPDPDNPSESVLPGLVSGAKDRADTTAANAARLQAIDAVHRIYLPIFPPSGQNVPALVPPPPTVNGGDGGTGGVSTGGGSGVGPGGMGLTGTGGDTPGGSSGSGQQDPQQDQTSPASADSANTPGTTTPAGTTSPGISGSGSGTGAGAPGAGGTATTPAGVSAPSQGAGLGGIGGGPSGGGGYFGTGGRSGSGAGAAGPGSSRPGVPGQGVPGAAAAASRGAAGGPAGPMSPMSPGAQGRRKDEDRSKPVPDYLKRVQPELADLPPAPTGAIGGDYATWQAPDAAPPKQPTTAAAPDSVRSQGVPIRYDDDPPPGSAQPPRETGR
ncbi:hypothetical protein IU500_19300 [Nocardia terpenica]|uniref:hypothetical protein n=1 Tax=Nocardia terpenica TaxID=455432 RepID=UPI0018947065|nr:hypothetical protein [Nocardia terpenica]MBF6062015.1 hypothetical protein [Nocardia terpenica]MBF6106185.1 hypothetical protein [Nocardia terpenica]MBF6110435.1 hypothetical protein [Nocardia terpenica]MBF6120728.1 hypothetical protein [Nocardia terpenica]MBF6151771.1 hypothetical protein [Nocardia terpenica]